MAQNRSFRQVHRWFAVIFTVTVITVTASNALGGPEWVNYLALPPLGLLLVTGVYLFALPYRRGNGSGISATG